MTNLQEEIKISKEAVLKDDYSDGYFYKDLFFPNESLLLAYLKRESTFRLIGGEKLAKRERVNKELQ